MPVTTFLAKGAALAPLGVDIEALEIDNLLDDVRAATGEDYRVQRFTIVSGRWPWRRKSYQYHVYRGLDYDTYLGDEFQAMQLGGPAINARNVTAFFYGVLAGVKSRSVAPVTLVRKDTTITKPAPVAPLSSIATMTGEQLREVDAQLRADHTNYGQSFYTIVDGRKQRIAPDRVQLTSVAGKTVVTFVGGGGPCVRCCIDNLDTGWECNACGYDNMPYYYPDANATKIVPTDPFAIVRVINATAKGAAS